MELKTITDFDFGVGGSITHTERVSQTPGDVTKLDVKFILWLMLEQEFRQAPQVQGLDLPDRTLKRTEHDGSGDGEEDNKALRSSSCAGFLRRVDAETEKIARKFAENSLKEAGIAYELLEDLPEEDRSEMIVQLCKGSELFPKCGSIRTVPQIFHALRSPSKFWNKFDVIQELARGEFGNVYQAKPKTAETETSKEYAVKEIEVTFKSLLKEKENVQMALNESNVLKDLKGHKNIVEYHDSWLELHQKDTVSDTDVTDGPGSNPESRGALKFYIQLELCDKTLLDWKNGIHERGEQATLNNDLMLKIAKDIFNGLAYIHEHNILHLDIKSANIMWANQDHTHLKILDFGLAVSGPKCDGRSGTPFYAAPERVLTAKSDVYSAAITIAEVTVFTQSELVRKLDSKSKRLDISCDSVLGDLLLRCLSHNPNDRPKAAEITKQL